MGDLGKIIVATGFECLPKKQKIAQSGHTAVGADVINTHLENLIGFVLAGAGTVEKMNLTNF